MIDSLGSILVPWEYQNYLKNIKKASLIKLTATLRAITVFFPDKDLTFNLVLFAFSRRTRRSLKV